MYYRKLKGKIFIVVIVIIAVLIILLLVCFKLSKGNFSFGFRNNRSAIITDTAEEGNHNENADNQNNANESNSVTATIQKKNIAEITVTNRIYIYNNKTYELNELIELLKSIDDLEVSITANDDATFNSMQDLTKELDNNKLEYKIIEE